jgi:hypothetical protein
MKALLVLTLLLTSVFSGQWEHRFKVDPMTDRSSLFLIQKSDAQEKQQSDLHVDFYENGMLIKVRFPEEIQNQGMLLIRWDKEKAYKIEVFHRDEKSVNIPILDKENPLRSKSMVDHLLSHNMLLMQYLTPEGEKKVVRFNLNGFSPLFKRYAKTLYENLLAKAKLKSQKADNFSPGQYAFQRNGCSGCHSLKKYNAPKI